MVMGDIDNNANGNGTMGNEVNHMVTARRATTTITTTTTMATTTMMVTATARWAAARWDKMTMAMVMTMATGEMIIA